MRLPTSPGLLFRPLTMEDVGDLCEILQDPVAMTAYEHAFSMEEVYTWLGRQQARYIRYGFGLWALLDSRTGEFVGQAGLTMQDTPAGPELEIGYLLKRRFWHRGYASRAAAACRDFAFDAWEAPRVVSIIRDTNEASQRVALRIGLKPESTFVKHYYGVDMPHIVYALRREDRRLDGRAGEKTDGKP